MICPACQEATGKICAQHLRTDNHSDEFDQWMDAANARIKRLEELLASTEQVADQRRIEIECLKQAAGKLRHALDGLVIVWAPGMPTLQDDALDTAKRALLETNGQAL